MSSSFNPSDRPTPNAPIFAESDLGWQVIIDIDGSPSVRLLGVRGATVTIPLSSFSCDAAIYGPVDIRLNGIPTDLDDPWWLLAASRYTGLERGRGGWPIHLREPIFELVADLCRLRPEDLREAGHDPTDSRRLACAVADAHWQQVARHLSPDPLRRWALQDRNAAWESPDPPDHPSPHEWFERGLLAEVVGQVLDEREVYRQRDHTDEPIATRLADAAMEHWRACLANPANAQSVAWRPLGRTVRLGPALDHLRHVEHSSTGHQPPLKLLLKRALLAVGLEDAARDASVLAALGERIDAMLLRGELLAHEPPSPSLYQLYFGLSERRYTRLMARAARL